MAESMHRHAHDHGAHTAGVPGGAPISFTGERILPGEPGWEWCFEAHRFAYEDLRARLQPGLRIIEIGCGEGYGNASIAEGAAFVVATDYDAAIVAHAKTRYGPVGMAFVVCDAQHLPFRAACADVVVSLQVIEHFTDTASHLAGVARALVDDGWYYCATPNIALMSEAEADNEFHLRDFTAPELHEALAERFGEVELLGQFYREDSPRVRAMRAADAGAERARPVLARIESAVRPLPGPLRTRARTALRALFRVATADADAARNAILAEDFVARPPAEESFNLIAIAKRPRRG